MTRTNALVDIEDKVLLSQGFFISTNCMCTILIHKINCFVCYFNKRLNVKQHWG